MKIPTHFSFHTIYLTAIGDAATASHLHYRMKPIFTTALRRALATLTRLLTLTILLLVGAIPSISASTSYDFIRDGIYYKITSTSPIHTVEVSSPPLSYGSSSGVYKGSITIPNYVSYSDAVYRVSGIGTSAFKSCTELIEVDLPETIESIGDFAFLYCSSITDIEIPNSVVSIGEYAFEHCSSLKNVRLPNAIANIPRLMFYGCSSLTNIDLPNSVVSIGEGAFQGCSSLEKVRFPNAITDIPARMFQGCTSLSNIEIPISVVSLGELSFSGCTALTEIVIPNSVTNMNYSTFSGCTSLKEIILPDKVAALPYGFLYGCFSLNEVLIPSSVTSIGDCAFKGCTALIHMDIPNSVNSIGTSAFESCSSLKDVRISTNLTEIPEECFYECTSLTEITIPEGVTKIGRAGFGYCSSLTKIEMTSSVTDIDMDAFYDTNLFSVSFSNNTVRTYQSKITRSGLYIDGKVAELNQPIGEWTRIDRIIDKKSPTFYISRGFYHNGNYHSWSLARFDAPNNPPVIKGVEAVATSPLSMDVSVELNLVQGVDPDPVNEYFTIGGKSYDASTHKITLDDLTPGVSYIVTYTTKLKGYSDYYSPNQWTSPKVKCVLPSLKLGAGEATATSYTSARLRCETNLPDGVSGGFEWMRENAPSSMKPSKAPCPVVNGALTGSLRNLKDEVYYKCRPYYIASNGTEYYGEWFIVFTGDAGVYFEPEVQTYAPKMTETADGFSVSLSGYALAGSDDITAQGFEYRAIGKSRAAAGWNSVKASGVLMNVTLEDLDAGTEYECRAFVQTSQGAFYGASHTFTTPNEAGAIDDVMVSPAEEATVVGYYNLQGIRLSAPTRGVNIVVYSDGTRRKVMM